MSVGVSEGAVVAYLPARDREVSFAGPEALVAWLDEQEAAADPG